MAIYNPPDYIQNLNLFNPEDFITLEDGITPAYLDANYLKFPNAQGNETLLNASVNGTLTIPNNDISLRGMRIGLGAGNQVRNTMLGVNNGNAITTGNNNTFIGALCGVATNTGRDNVFVGTFSGIKNTTGFQNTFVGIDAGNFCTTGGRNTHIGRQAGYYNTGSNNICIGDWADASGNISNSIAIGVDVKATANDVIVLGTSSHTTQIAGAVVVGSNSNLTMNAGTGRINQPSVVGDVSTKNTFKLSDFTFNSNVPTGTQNAFEFYDGVNGKGLFLIPNCSSGSLGSTNITNDCVLSSRSIQNTNAITISNWNENMRNGLRVFTTDASNCGLTLQCGQNLTGDWAEFRMSHTRTGGVNLRTTTFNDVINFNPTTPSAITGARRQLIGLGTLSFTDISGNNSTNGAFISRIWSDSSLTTGLGTGMFYDCSMGGLCGHTFRVSDGVGNKINVLSMNSSGITSRESLTFASTAIADRNINNVGTLSFLDLSANTTQGTTISNIYTDSSLVGGIGGMYYQNNINGGFHIFQAKDSLGNTTSPIYYGSSLTSVSNTFIVRNSTITSNRLDFSADTSQNFFLEAKTNTNSTIANLHIDCQERSAGGGLFGGRVATFTPSSLTIRRPIQFDYITVPNANNQLGYALFSTALFDGNLSASASVQNAGNFSIPARGTWIVQATVRLTGSASHTLTTFKAGINGVSATLPSLNNMYSMSLVGHQNIALSTTQTADFPMTSIYQVPASGTVYVVVLIDFAGGGTVNVKSSYALTRIG